MAESKKSFVLYNDYGKVFEMLTDEEAGKLIKHLFAYVNNKDTELEDRLLKLTFEPIKLQLMRDNKKYEAICERNKNNGKKGGRPPKKPSGLIENPENPVGYLVTQNNPEKPKKPDNDNDNDNDNDTDISINKERETRTQQPKSTNPDYIKFNNWIQEKAPYCSNPRNFPHQITEEEFIKLKKKYSGQQIADIVEKIENRKDLRKRYSNLYLTVNNWLKKEFGA